MKDIQLSMSDHLSRFRVPDNAVCYSGFTQTQGIGPWARRETIVETDLYRFPELAEDYGELAILVRVNKGRLYVVSIADKVLGQLRHGDVVPPHWHRPTNDQIYRYLSKYGEFS